MSPDEKQRLMHTAKHIYTESCNCKNSSAGTKLRKDRLAELDHNDRYYVAAYIDGLILKRRRKIWNESNFGNEQRPKKVIA